MAIARRTGVQFATSGTSTTSALTLTNDASWQVGDLIVCVIAVVDNALTTAPSVTQANFTARSSGAAGYLKLQVWTRFIQSGDPGSWSFTFDRTSVYCMAASAYSGVDTTTPFSAGPTYKATPTSTLSPVTDSLTPGSTNDWILTAFADRNTTSTRKTTAWAPTAPLVEREDLNNSSKASAPWMSLEYGDDNTTVGSTSAQTRTSTRSGGVTANTNWQGVIMALNPAAAGGSALTQNVDDTVTMSDAVTFGPGLVLADSATLADSVAMGPGLGLADSINLADALAMGVGLSLADTLTLADAIANGIGLGIDDAVALADSINEQLTAGGQALTQSIDDTVSLADALAMGVGLGIDDSVALVDSTSFGLGLGIDDAIPLVDALMHDAGLSLNDAITIADHVSFLLNGQPFPPTVKAQVIEYFVTKFGFYTPKRGFHP